MKTFFLISNLILFNNGLIDISISIDPKCLEANKANKFMFSITNKSNHDITLSKDFLFWKVIIKNKNGNYVNVRRSINPNKAPDDLVLVPRQTNLTFDVYSDIICNYNLTNGERYTLELIYHSTKARSISKIGEIHLNKLDFEVCL